MSNPFRYFNSSPEVIRLVVMMYVRYPLSLRNVEDLLAERGIDISHGNRSVLVEPVWPDIRCRDPQERRRAHARLSRWRWHLDEAFGEGQRQALLPVARDRSRRTGLGGGSDGEAGQGCSAEASQRVMASTADRGSSSPTVFVRIPRRWLK